MCRDCGCSTASVFRSERKNLKPLSVGFLSEVAETREVKVEESIFQRNQLLAESNRRRFAQTQTRVFNLMSSPGSGKTTLLTKLLPELTQTKRIVVLVGDQETSLDSERLQAAGLDALQINTHSSCHLDASRIAQHLPESRLASTDWVVIENVGNLVCPAVFDLGEQTKIALLSVTEGEEKPLKYPVLFQDANLIVITKIDLLPYLDIDVDLLTKNLRQQNPNAEILFCSAKTGEGLKQLRNTLEVL